MRDVFLADAHLRAPEDLNYRKLQEFLRGLEGSTRTLYLLGDIFQFWVGYRHCVFSPYVPLLESLRRLRESGTEIVYVEGNHDFHLGPYFRDVLGCRILPDGGTVDIDGCRIRLEHGDLIDGEDRGYRLLRAVLRSRLLRFAIHIVPPDWTWAIGQWMNRRSQQRRARRNPPRVKLELLEAFAATQIRNGCRAVVMGHFHTPLQRDLEGGTLVALGDWIGQFSYAVWEDGRIVLHQA